MNILSPRKTLENNLTFSEFCGQLQHLPIPPDEMEKFKNEAKRIIRERGMEYTTHNLLDVMYWDLYKLANYRP